MKVSVNVTFDDTKLLSLQSANRSESLKFDNYLDSDSDDDGPLEAATGDDNNDDNDPGNGGGNGNNAEDSTDASGGSSSQPGNN